MQQYLSSWNVVNVLYIINLIFRTSEQKISFFGQIIHVVLLVCLLFRCLVYIPAYKQSVLKQDRKCWQNHLYA